MRGAWMLGALMLMSCTEPVVRLTPPECAARQAAHTRAAAELERATEEARAALGEEAATLAWWKVHEAQEKVDAAEEALRGCP